MSQEKDQELEVQNTDTETQSDNPKTDQTDLQPEQKQTEQADTDQNDSAENEQMNDLLGQLDELSEQTRKENSNNEIDEFAKALLDKKTEMALYVDTVQTDEVLPENSTPELSEQDRIEAEGTMAQALDVLRKERGQIPIDQEEEDFAWNQLVQFEDRFSDFDEDFTTESLFKEEERPVGNSNLGLYTETPSNQDYIEETEKRPAKKRFGISRASKNKDQNRSLKEDAAKTAAVAGSTAAFAQNAVSDHSASISGLDETKNLSEPAAENSLNAAFDEVVLTEADKPQRKENASIPVLENIYETPADQGIKLVQDPEDDNVSYDEEDSKDHKAIWISLLLLCLLVLLGGAYYYKTQVYDPAHAVTETQQAAIDSLKQFADDYIAMDDEQKKGINDLLPQYNELTDSQKSEINQYFNDKTGHTFAVLANVPGSSSDSSSDSNSDSQSSSSDSSAESDASASNQQSQSEQDNNGAGTQVNTQDNQNGQNSSSSNNPDNSTSVDADNSANNSSSDNTQSSSAASSSDLAAYQAELNQLQTDKSNYEDFLNAEGLPTEGDEILAGYDEQISHYQDLINQAQ